MGCPVEIKTANYTTILTFEKQHIDLQGKKVIEHFIFSDNIIFILTGIMRFTHQKTSLQLVNMAYIILI